MKGNLKKAVILLMSLGFMYGLALGKIHDNYRKQKQTDHSKIILFQTHQANVHALQLQEELRQRVEEKLRRAEEIQKRALERVVEAEKRRFRFNCH